MTTSEKAGFSLAAWSLKYIGIAATMTERQQQALDELIRATGDLATRLAAAEGDARRYRWLTEDHADAWTRA